MHRQLSQFTGFRPFLVVLAVIIIITILGWIAQLIFRSRQRFPTGIINPNYIELNTSLQRLHSDVETELEAPAGNITFARTTTTSSSGPGGDADITSPHEEVGRTNFDVKLRLNDDDDDSHTNLQLPADRAGNITFARTTTTPFSGPGGDADIIPPRGEAGEIEFDFNFSLSDDGSDEEYNNIHNQTRLHQAVMTNRVTETRKK
jgi:hypothetical protein